MCEHRSEERKTLKEIIDLLTNPNNEIIIERDLIERGGKLSQRLLALEIENRKLKEEADKDEAIQSETLRGSVIAKGKSIVRELERSQKYLGTQDQNDMELSVLREIASSLKNMINPVLEAFRDAEHIRLEAKNSPYKVENTIDRKTKEYTLTEIVEIAKFLKEV